jgi:hypothetical protein
MYRVNEKCIKSFCLKNLRIIDGAEVLSIDKKII